MAHVYDLLHRFVSLEAWMLIVFRCDEQNTA